MGDEVHDYGLSVKYLNVQLNDIDEYGMHDNGTSTSELRLLTICCKITLEVNFFPQLIVEAGCEEELQHHHTHKMYLVLVLSFYSRLLQLVQCHNN